MRVSGTYLPSPFPLALASLFPLSFSSNEHLFLPVLPSPLPSQTLSYKAPHISPLPSSSRASCPSFLVSPARQVRLPRRNRHRRWNISWKVDRNLFHPRRRQYACSELALLPWRPPRRRPTHTSISPTRSSSPHPRESGLLADRLYDDKNNVAVISVVDAIDGGGYKLPAIVGGKDRSATNANAAERTASDFIGQTSHSHRPNQQNGFSTRPLNELYFEQRGQERVGLESKQQQTPSRPGCCWHLRRGKGMLPPSQPLGAGMDRDQISSSDLGCHGGVGVLKNAL